MCSDSRYILKMELRGADTLLVVCEERRSHLKLHSGPEQLGPWRYWFQKREERRVEEERLRHYCRHYFRCRFIEISVGHSSGDVE